MLRILIQKLKKSYQCEQFYVAISVCTSWVWELTNQVKTAKLSSVNKPQVFSIFGDQA